MIEVLKLSYFHGSFFVLQQFGKILDVEIIFNERGSKVSSLIHLWNFKICLKCFYE